MMLQIPHWRIPHHHILPITGKRKVPMKPIIRFSFSMFHPLCLWIFPWHCNIQNWNCILFFLLPEAAAALSRYRSRDALPSSGAFFRALAFSLSITICRGFVDSSLRSFLSYMSILLPVFVASSYHFVRFLQGHWREGFADPERCPAQTILLIQYLHFLHLLQFRTLKRVQDVIAYLGVAAESSDRLIDHCILQGCILDWILRRFAEVCRKYRKSDI